MDTAIIWLVVLGLCVAKSFLGERQNHLQSSRRMATRFHNLRSMRGMYKATIIQKVGIPQSVSSVEDGEILTWSTSGFNASIKFDMDGLFAGVVYEHSSL
jgi:hypothetical protein